MLFYLEYSHADESDAFDSNTDEVTGFFYICVFPEINICVLEHEWWTQFTRRTHPPCGMLLKAGAYLLPFILHVLYALCHYMWAGMERFSLRYMQVASHVIKEVYVVHMTLMSVHFYPISLPLVCLVYRFHAPSGILLLVV